MADLTHTNASEEARARVDQIEALALADRFEERLRYVSHNPLAYYSIADVTNATLAARLLRAAFAKPSPDTLSGEVERGYAAGLKAAAAECDKRRTETIGLWDDGWNNALDSAAIGIRSLAAVEAPEGWKARSWNGPGSSGARRPCERRERLYGHRRIEPRLS